MDFGQRGVILRLGEVRSFIRGSIQKMRLKRNIPTILAFATALGLCLLFTALLLCYDRESLSYLQKMIIENGRCSVYTGYSDYVFQADTAKIENDTLILQRSAATGKNSLVIIGSNSGTFSAKSVSIRFITDPTDMIELTFHQPEGGKLKTIGTMRHTLKRRSFLRRLLDYFPNKLWNSNRKNSNIGLL